MSPRTMKVFLATAILSIFPTAFLLLERAYAYDKYSVNRDATNCRACHGPIGAYGYKSKVDGSAWNAWWGPASLHDGHQEMLLNNSTGYGGCRSCHTYDNFPVLLKRSVDPAPFNNSCLACHGRVEGGVLTGAGLMQRHYRRGITSCANCHPKANPANYTPVGENVQPPGYFLPDPDHPNKPTDSCNSNGQENKYGTPRGLDLDGDLLDDSADPDCSTSTAPDTTITSSPPNPSNSASATFLFTSNNPTATFECALDAAGYAACVSPKSYTGLADGSHTFSVRAKDAAGNVDPSPAAFGWTVDSAAPDTTITSSPPNPSISTTAGFAFTATETGSTFECALDAAGYAACVSPKSYTGLADGSHTFSVRAKDAAGNVDPSPAAFGWTVDSAAPDTTITSSPPNPSTGKTANFAFTSSETGSTFECDLDAAGYAACVSPKSYTGLADGNHTFSVRAKDAAGNVDPSPATYTWTISVGTVKHDLTVSGDGSGDFLAIQTAIDSITDASANNQYRITVKPGTYMEAIQIKSFVAVIGGGRGNTTIVFDGPSPTVELADGTSLEHLTVTSNSAGDFSIVQVANNAYAEIRDVRILLPDVQTGLVAGTGASVAVIDSYIEMEDLPSRDRFGILSFGTSLLVSGCTIDKPAATSSSFVTGIYDQSTGKTTISNVIVRVAGNGCGIYADDNVDITHSEISVEGSPVASYAAQVGVLTSGNVNIRNSEISTSGDAVSETSGVSVNGGKTLINNSTIRSSTSSSPSYGIKILGSVEVNSSSVSGGTLALYKSGLSDSFRIGSSQIRGGHNGPAGDDKIIHCFDETFAPLPNF